MKSWHTYILMTIIAKVYLSLLKASLSTSVVVSQLSSTAFIPSLLFIIIIARVHLSLLRTSLLVYFFSIAVKQSSSVHLSLHSCRSSSLQNLCIHTYVHTQIHRYIHTYIHTYIDICVYTCHLASVKFLSLWNAVQKLSLKMC